MNTNRTLPSLKLSSLLKNDLYLGVISLSLLTGTVILVIVAMFAPEILLAEY